MNPIDDDGLSDFVDSRRRLLGIAYRMLGSATEAEDVVQDVWLRWQNTDRSVVRNATAFLVTSTVRLAINALQSARVRLEICDSAWLSESVDSGANPQRGVESRETLERVVLVLLQRLSPAERAVYVLREAFSYSHREIAVLLRISEENTRQLLTRARKHVGNARRAPVSWRERQSLLGGFLAATRSGDFAALEAALSAAVVPSHSTPGHRHAGSSSRIPMTRVPTFTARWEGRTISGSESRAT
jgi:RNA polymerase sigma-70 factor, ECF subfamily